MKLTEKQLAQMFQANKNAPIESKVQELESSLDASDARLHAVEKIADNSQLSACYLAIHQLQPWSEDVSKEIVSLSQPHSDILVSLMRWYRTGLATAALVTAVYFITPNMQNSVNAHNQPDRIMFTTGFENSTNDVIQSVSFDNKGKLQKSDTINKMNFG